MHLRSYAPLGGTVTKLNWHRIKELYDFTRSTSRTVAARFLCDQLVHSYVFALSFGAARALDGFFVVSDRDRATRLQFVTLARFVALLRTVGTEDYDTMITEWDSKKGDYKTRAYLSKLDR